MFEGLPKISSGNQGNLCDIVLLAFVNGYSEQRVKDALFSS